MDQPSQGNWWSRNWKWVVPVGCLVPIVLGSGVVFLVVSLVFGAIKSSDAYTQAVARARANDEVKAVLGEPIQTGYFVSGNISVDGSSGNADFSIPLSGPKGSATLYVTAKKAAGRWEFTTLEVAPKGSDTRIDLQQRVSPRPNPQTQ
jgi:Cytochrome oxidase complex assembly protein 1